MENNLTFCLTSHCKASGEVLNGNRITPVAFQKSLTGRGGTHKRTQRGCYVKVHLHVLDRSQEIREKIENVPDDSP